MGASVEGRLFAEPTGHGEKNHINRKKEEYQWAGELVLFQYLLSWHQPWAQQLQGWLGHLLHSRSAQDLLENKEGTKVRLRGRKTTSWRMQRGHCGVLQFSLYACCRMVGAYSFFLSFLKPLTNSVWSEDLQWWEMSCPEGCMPWFCSLGVWEVWARQVTAILQKMAPGDALPLWPYFFSLPLNNLSEFVHNDFVNLFSLVHMKHRKRYPFSLVKVYTIPSDKF